MFRVLDHTQQYSAILKTPSSALKFTPGSAGDGDGTLVSHMQVLPSVLCQPSVNQIFQKSLLSGSTDGLHVRELHEGLIKGKALKCWIEQGESWILLNLLLINDVSRGQVAVGNGGVSRGQNSKP